MNGIIHKALMTCLLFVVMTAHPSIAQDCLHLSGFDTCQCDSLSCDAAAPGCDCVGGCDFGQCSCQHQSCWTQPTLTGDWCGLRSHLQQSGITFRGTSTHYGFAIDGGVNTPVPPPLSQGDTFKYTGRNEYDLIFDLEKFGGLPKGRLLVRAEQWYGDFGNVSLASGTFTPPVFPALLPTNINDPGVPILSNFLFTQPLSERLVVFVGKSDVLGKADQDIFAGGDGTEQFINQALIANPAFLLGLPYTSFAAGFVMPLEWGSIRGFVRDPQGRTKDFFKLNDLFSKGVLIGGQVQLKTNFLRKPGEHHVGGVWKHVDLPDLASSASLPGQFPSGTTIGLGTKPDSYTIYYGFDQYLRIFSNEPRRGWGLFGRASISDGNPTPLRYFLSAGIGGDSPIQSHRGDTFGIGWYYNGTTSDFGPFSQALLGPQHGTGAELYYNFQLTPWLNVSPDLQFIRPAASALADDSVIYGLRVNMTL
jgi:porin